MKIQLEKESKIRDNVKEILEGTLPAINLFKYAVHGNPQALASDVTDILPVLHKSLRSPLVAGQLKEILLDMRHCVFNATDETIAQYVAGVNLQVKDILKYRVDQKKLIM